MVAHYFEGLLRPTSWAMCRPAGNHFVSAPRHATCLVAVGPVAQSVERWTPYGGSICPGFKSPGFEARRAPDVYRASWRVWSRLVAGRSQSMSAIGTGRARLCAYVKLSTLNSAIDPELRDRKVEDRANATSSA